MPGPMARGVLLQASWPRRGSSSSVARSSPPTVRRASTLARSSSLTGSRMPRRSRLWRTNWRTFLLHEHADYHQNRCALRGRGRKRGLPGVPRALVLETDQYTFPYVATWAGGDVKIVTQAADVALEVRGADPRGFRPARRPGRLAIPPGRAERSPIRHRPGHAGDTATTLGGNAMTYSESARGGVMIPATRVREELARGWLHQPR